MKKVFILVFLMVVFGTIQAQNKVEKRPASFGIFGGYKSFMSLDQWEDLSATKYILGDLGKGKVGEKGNPRAFIGFQYLKGISKTIDFSTSIDFGNFVYPYTNGKPAETSKKILITYNANVNLKLFDDSHVFVPYLTGGIGASLYNFDKLGHLYNLGGGFQIKVAESKFINLQAANFYKGNTWNSRHGQYSISFVAPFKKKIVKPIPVPPAPAPEKDSDGDGVVDSKDKCPTIAGIAKYGGCPIPDTDKDGINDELDKCPTVAGLAKYGGCPIPDTDKDGINDEEDKCPTVAGVAKYGGCPIPDSDNDGVNDEEDKCPTEPGTKATNGCPDVQPIINGLAKKIFFNNGSAAINLKASKKNLDEVASILTKYPTIKISIEGYTDNQGGAKKNKILSQKRADALKAYFTKKGIAAERISAIGYGIENPIGDNKTAKGRALNRRVELKASY